MRTTHAPAITWRIVLLVAASVLATALVSFAITFNGPPPFPMPYRAEEVAAALAGRPVRGPGPKAILRQMPALPQPSAEQARDPITEQTVARVLGVAPSQVVAWSSGWRAPRPGGEGPRLMSDFTIAVRGPAGWTVAVNSPRPWLTNWHRITLASLVGALILLTILGWFIARAITRPLSRLADAADAVSASHRSLPVEIEGPPEVRRVAGALNAMRARLVDHVAQRTAMLAAITHDLGTPLTRLAFRIEALPAADRIRALADIEEMRGMIMSVLEFARGETRAPAPLDLAPLLAALADGMNATVGPVAQSIATPLPMTGDDGALRRLFTNLLENALRYGQSASLTATARDGHVIVTIDDDGPGIPPALAQSLFDPFVRAEPSRSRETGGIGLGLAIARNVVEAHGGSIAAQNRPQGGARLTVSLPLR
ncbi:sensor histidine kinase [Sphingobium boeckii]|uniref:histidine kinase n=1 Tax=Sphingobium boeckii TaxID=1082345 RepID=A0A7W9EE44_9SPHN|nr:HAMP domain-containing sensor histidine kinase [Sphingobium boeckii]MBB5684620.1 signal transduction histidine kinase [Sphingobium boeckii]